MPSTTGSQPLAFSAVAGPGFRYTKSRLIWMLSHSGSLGGSRHITMWFVGSRAGSALCVGYNFGCARSQKILVELYACARTYLAGQARLTVPYIQVSGPVVGSGEQRRMGRVSWALAPLLADTAKQRFGCEPSPTTGAVTAAAGVAEGAFGQLWQSSGGSVVVRSKRRGRPHGRKARPKHYGALLTGRPDTALAKPRVDLHLQGQQRRDQSAKAIAIATPNRTLRRILTRDGKTFSRFNFVLSRSHCP